MIAYRSISLRLTVWFSLVLFGGLSLFGATMWFDLKEALTSGRSRTLERRTGRLEDLLRDIQLEPASQRAQRYQAFANATGGGLIEVFETNGARSLPSPTEAAQTFPWPRITPAAGDRFSETEFQGQTYRILVHPISRGSLRLVLCAAAPMESNRMVLSAYSAGLFWAIPVVLVISSLGGYTVSRRALKPVDEITAATQSISVSNLSARLAVPETRDELQRLSETHNAMLARLEAAVNEIKRFTGDASHELRTPVSFVRTTAELALRNRRIDPVSRRAFEEIVAECGKAANLLKDMLTLARADAGNARLAFEPVDLAEVVSTVSQRACSLAGKHGHTLTVNVEQGVSATVWGDYASLQRLLWILLDNAVKYTEVPGRIRITLAGAGENVILRVEDNGMGISELDLPHIFGRFFRADPSRSQVEGSGLGLSIAKWIAGAHHATLSADSRERVGSVFKVVFPLLAVDHREPKSSKSQTHWQAFDHC